MLKLILTKPDGGRVIVLGVEERNLERLREGRPLHIFLRELMYGGERDELVIYYGRDHEALIDELRNAGLPLPPEAGGVLTAEKLKRRDS